MTKKILVTGSSGHLGEALMRHFASLDHPAIGIDIKPSPWTEFVGSIADPDLVRRACDDVDAIMHTATLHKPHVVTHSRQQFIDTNVTGTLRLLEAAASNRMQAFVFTSTTSVFGDALIPPPGEPAAWITETVQPIPKNIYGATKSAAEDLCRLFHRNQGLASIILRTSRFFPEADDNASARENFDDSNLKTNEFLHRRVDIEDVVAAHMLALEKAQNIGFGRYIISATTPFERSDLPQLRQDVSTVVERRVAGFAASYETWGWRMFERLDRVYVNECARLELGWSPRYDFAHILDRRQQGLSWQSDLALAIGRKGYHDRVFEEGPFPVD